MDRVNSEGIPRGQLKFALKQWRLVMTARRTDSCLLCRQSGVNEAGLCNSCYSMLSDDEELRLVAKWQSGEGP